jgi:hypothetical protein
MSSAFMIIIDRPTTDLLNAVHELIKQKTDKWWHRYDAVWIVLGGTATEWRDLIKPLISDGPSILVFRLPDENDQRQWAASGPSARERFVWLREEYWKDPKA